MAAIERTRPGRVARWKLTEPVRLYVYGGALLLLLALAVVGTVTGEWRGVALAGLALLFTAPGVEAARASVYSPRSVMQTLMQVRQQ